MNYKTGSTLVSPHASCCAHEFWLNKSQDFSIHSNPAQHSKMDSLDMAPSIEEIYNLAKIIVDGGQQQTPEEKQQLQGIFNDMLEVVDATLSLKLDGISMEEFNPHYLEYRKKVEEDFSNVLYRKPNSLAHLREDLARLNNHLSQATGPKPA